MILIDFKDAQFDALEGCLRIKPTNLPMVKQWLVREYQADKTYTAEIKRMRKKRSCNANSLAWALIGKLAEAMQESKEKIYIDHIRDVGPYKVMHLLPDDANTFRTAWEMLGIGWPTEQVDADGEFLIINAYYGSSTYNTKQMSALINKLMQDCEAIGITTISEKDKALLLDDWNNHQWKPKRFDE